MKDSLEALKIYSYLDTWKDKIFPRANDTVYKYIFAITVIAMYDGAELHFISNKLNLKTQDTYRVLQELEISLQLVTRVDSKYYLSKQLQDNVDKETFNATEVQISTFNKIIKNLSSHCKVIGGNLGISKKEELPLVHSLINPLMSNPIHIDDCRQLSKLGYMKYNNITKKLKLNSIAYQKDWSLV